MSSSTAAPARGGRPRGARAMIAGPVTAVAAGVVVVIVLAGVLAPVLAPYSPTDVDLAHRLAPMSGSHPFGTDEVGRDILTRIIYGVRVSLGVSVLTVAGSAVIGMILGAIAGYFGGWLDTVIMRAIDVLLSFPSLILAIALAAALGPSLVNAAIAICVVKIPVYARLAYAETLATRQQLFVRAARTFGVSDAFVIARHIVPSIRSSIIVQTTLDLGDVILLIAALGFLGLGAQPPSAEWGSMISTGWHYLIDQWWYPTFTGAAIFLTVMSFNLLGDGARDHLDANTM